MTHIINTGDCCYHNNNQYGKNIVFHLRYPLNVNYLTFAFLLINVYILYVVYEGINLNNKNNHFGSPKNIDKSFTLFYKIVFLNILL